MKRALSGQSSAPPATHEGIELSIEINQNQILKANSDDLAALARFAEPARGLADQFTAAQWNRHWDVNNPLVLVLDQPEAMLRVKVKPVDLPDPLTDP